MFLKDTEISVNWYLPATTNTYNYTEFDVIVRKPDGSSYYVTSAILQNDFIAPTPTTVGGVTYKVTPDEVGLWVIILTIGDENLNDTYYEYFMRVSVPDTHIYQQVTI